MRFALLALTTALVAQGAQADTVSVPALDFDLTPVTAGSSDKPQIVAPRRKPSADAPIIIASLSPLNAGPGETGIRSDAPPPSLLLGLIETPEIIVKPDVTEEPDVQEQTTEETETPEPTAEDLVTAAAFAFDDANSRDALRDEDPDLFAMVVDSGLTDPPEDRIVTHLQSELERMNCYTGGVDGMWGNGSRGGVSRYFEELGEDPPTLEPSTELYRAITLGGDVECTVVASTTPRNQTATTTRTRTKSSTTTASRPKATTPRKSTTTTQKTTTSKKKRLSGTALGNTF